MKYLRKKPIYLKADLCFSIQPDKIRKSEILTTFEIFIFLLLTTLNPRKPKVRQNCISRILLIPISTTSNLLRVYYVNTLSYKTLEKIEISL